MALSDDAIVLAGLIEIDLPGGMVRLCDGGAVMWGANLFDGEHATLGSVAAMDQVEEGIGDDLPQWKITFAPADDADAVTITSATYQGRSIRFWLAEVAPETGLVVGTPELLLDGLIDQPVLRMSLESRLVEWSVMPRVERLLMMNEGNTLSGGFHKSIWPGELGFDNATGQQLSVAWGVKAPPRGTVGGGSFAAPGRGGGLVDDGLSMWQVMA